ncbi:MAG TPA: hypothetical protein PLG41_08225, partial [Leptospiraceae bacterium]|nr:hypothetical protein [Leptospiraceae bacterium]
KDEQINEAPTGRNTLRMGDSSTLHITHSTLTITHVAVHLAVHVSVQLYSQNSLTKDKLQLEPQDELQRGDKRGKTKQIRK